MFDPHSSLPLSIFSNLVFSSVIRYLDNAEKKHDENPDLNLGGN
jgi:hypothetical protein